jgi:tetratricopeptide (TPR) repeat protein
MPDFPDPSPVNAGLSDETVADIRSELDSLRLLVESTDGSLITFVRYRTLSEREAGVRYLKENLSIPVVERALSEEEKSPRPILESLPDERRCVQIYDLEEALPEVTGYLNLGREAYGELPHALVFWVGDYGIREVAQNAPDFWDWRSGVFDVRSESADLAQSVSQMAIADDTARFTSRGDMERRARLYESLIEDRKGDDKDEEYVTDLHLKLANLYGQLRRPDEAEMHAHQGRKSAESRDADEQLARAYHVLGIIEQDRRNFDEAEHWYRQSLEVKERVGDEHGVATTYHQLGNVALRRRDFDDAERWYQQSLDIEKRIGNESGAAKTYHQLGVVAQERRNLDDAERWYRQSLDIKERIDDEHRPAKTYHQLGRIAQERRNFDDAERWYQQSLEITERIGDEHQAARTYHGLGILAQDRRDFDEAERWYQKSLDINRRVGDEHAAAMTLAQQGILLRERGDFQKAGQRSLKAMQTFQSANDSRSAGRAAAQFARIVADAPSDVQNDLRAEWVDAGFDEDELEDLLAELREGE